MYKDKYIEKVSNLFTSIDDAKESWSISDKMANECVNVCLGEMIGLLDKIIHNGNDKASNIDLRLQIDIYYEQLQKAKDAVTKNIETR